MPQQMGARPIELLAPAKDLETARAAIAHGADAVYVGAPRFGARSAAGVPLADLAVLCREAHLYRVRVYVALNTILYDDELLEAERLVWDIYHAGADAVIVQDMALTKMHLPPIPLHASTQCDTTDPEDAVRLEALGFEQIVLARELNIEQIRQIRAVTTRPLEVFVHGALCVSYSGRCYLSEATTQRSANRGACSQQCRLPYDLRDNEGRLLREGEHLLSPRDLNRSALLEELLDAGVSSLKIEGRLKGISYVKNITAYYRGLLDKLIERYPDRYCRASLGHVEARFTPDPYKSFNRGFTDYQLSLATSTSAPRLSLINPRSPKSQGEYVGTLRRATADYWEVETKLQLTNGDGLLYITPEGRAGGVRINRAEGNRIWLARGEQIPRGSQLWRNYDQAMERLLSVPSAERRMPVALRLRRLSWGLCLEIVSVEDTRLRISQTLALDLEEAKRFDGERLRGELSKLGDTPLVASEVELDLGSVPPFIPLSLLSTLRREAVGAFVLLLGIAHRPDSSLRTLAMPSVDRSTLPRGNKPQADYRANISNHLSRAHYSEMGYGEVDDAFELHPTMSAALMTTKHCLRYELGYCTREGKGKMPYSEPLWLEQGASKLRLEFDCTRCQMLIYGA